MNILLFCLITQIPVIPTENVQDHVNTKDEIRYEGTHGNNTYDHTASTFTAKKFIVKDPDNPQNIMEFTFDGPRLVIKSTVDILLDPTYSGTSGGQIHASTAIRISEDTTGEKIYMYEDSYGMAIDPFYMRFFADRNFIWKTDDNIILMYLLGDEGDLWITRNLVTGGSIHAGTFHGINNTDLGLKYDLYDSTGLYGLWLESNTFVIKTDRNLVIESDTVDDSFVFDANEGVLTVNGPQKKVSLKKINFTASTGTLNDLLGNMNEGDMVLWTP